MELAPQAASRAVRDRDVEQAVPGRVDLDTVADCARVAISVERQVLERPREDGRRLTARRVVAGALDEGVRAAGGLADYRGPYSSSAKDDLRVDRQRTRDAERAGWEDDGPATARVGRVDRSLDRVRVVGGPVALGAERRHVVDRRRGSGDGILDLGQSNQRRGPEDDSLGQKSASREVRHEGSAASTCSGWPSGFTFFITLAMFPSPSMTNVVRLTPQYVLPA